MFQFNFSKGLALQSPILGLSSHINAVFHFAALRFALLQFAVLRSVLFFAALRFAVLHFAVLDLPCCICVA